MKDLFFINEDIFSFDKVIIFGAGMAGRHMLFKLLQQNVKVECFADSDLEKCGIRYLNIPIVHINELTEIHKTAAVIVSGAHALTAAAELKKRGFENLFFDYGNDVNIIHLKRED